MSQGSEYRQRAHESKSFIVVLDGDGNILDRDANADEAYQKAMRHSPTGTVVVDRSVEAAQGQLVSNPPITEARAIAAAMRMSGISTDKLSNIDWSEFDPLSDKGDEKLVASARKQLRERGAEIYAGVIDDARKLVHYRQTRGGIARQFNDKWLAGDFLRQNQKMEKILDLDAAYDSIGLSLLPHGASFRAPFDTSTEQERGQSFCAFSTPECRMACLVNTGQRALESGAFASSYLFSNLLRELPVEFCLNIFERSLAAFKQSFNKGHGRFIRLNVLSDLPWETLAPGMIESIGALARGHFLAKDPSDWEDTDGYSFYDYTKIPYRRGIEGYYDLTFSFAGQKNLYDAFFDVLDGHENSAKRAAVVFMKRETSGKKTYRAAPGKPLMTERKFMDFKFMGMPVWNGDKSDIRPLDPEGVKIVGLAYKVSRYKIAARKGEMTAEGKQKKFKLLNVVDSHDLDKKMPTFLVRVIQPDPDAPPVVAATQDLDNRVLDMFNFGLED